MSATSHLCERCGEYTLQVYEGYFGRICLRCWIILRRNGLQGTMRMARHPCVAKDAERPMEIPDGCTWRFLWAWWLYGKKEPNARNRHYLGVTE